MKSSILNYLKKSSVLLLVLLSLFINTFVYSQNPIKVNQVGFYPESPKIAVIPGKVDGEFKIIEAGTDDTVYVGKSSEPQLWEHSGEMVSIADFSDFSQPGKYYVIHPTVGISHNFEIKNDVHRYLSKSAIRALYYNRASMDLEKIHAGKWARSAGHPDTVVYVHESAASAERPEGYVISSPKGWYDAGDYNKYIVNSGISTYSIMAAYAHFPEYYDNLFLNIPESENQVPDILDEARWNLDWMITMQDPHDGGVYHKLTHLSFQGIMMPHEATANRYVVMKTTAAALNFAAVMAKAARTYDEFDNEFADKCLKAAKKAWEWAINNPDVYYDQPADVHTGVYGDSGIDDEFDWAAAELYITTNNDDYWDARDFKSLEEYRVPVWQYVRPLAWTSLANHIDDLTDAADINLIERNIIELCDSLVDEYKNSAYRVSMGFFDNDDYKDFDWGSNGNAANHSFMLIQAYRLTENSVYLDAAQAILDYLLGRNATGYCFVTGFGEHTPTGPHHRPSAADEVNDKPVPGFLVGGPHARQADGCRWYPSTFDAKSYRDDWCSYSTNEVTINWNAALIYITGAIEYYRSK